MKKEEAIEKYISYNKLSWNQRTEAHFASEFYDVKSFLAGKSSLQNIELELLGDVKGKSILHLQCHFGQDSISLARMGASVTGIDFSDAAIDKAKTLARDAQADLEFICCDVYDLPNHLSKKYDIVFTSYGTIGWLPDLDKWAKVIEHFLLPKGKLIFVEFHPFMWIWDSAFNEIKYSYFNKEAIHEVEKGTYAEKESTFEHETISWNHPLTDVIGSLFKQDLILSSFKEYNFSPYDCFPNSKKDASGMYYLEKFGHKIPMVYSLVAERK